MPKCRLSSDIGRPQLRLKCRSFAWYRKKFTNRAPLDEKPLAYRQAEEAEKAATPAP
jgi:hypothetical protein